MSRIEDANWLRITDGEGAELCVELSCKDLEALEGMVADYLDSNRTSRWL